MKITYNPGNISKDAYELIKHAIVHDDLLMADFGNIGGIVIDGTSPQASSKVIEIKSSKNMRRSGPLSWLMSLEDIFEYEIIDIEKVGKLLNPPKAEKVSIKDHIYNILLRFSGLAFIRIPISPNVKYPIPHYMVEDHDGIKTIQFFSFLGAQGELVKDIRAEIIAKKGKDSVPIIGVTSLNLSGQVAATSEKEIERVIHTMGYTKYISVNAHSPYRKGSFPILDLSGLLSNKVSIAREGNLSVETLRLFYKGISNPKDTFLSKLLNPLRLNQNDKEIYELCQFALKRLKKQYKNEDELLLNLRDYLLNILQEINSNEL